MAKRKQTFHRGASIERSALVEYLKRLRRNGTPMGMVSVPFIIDMILDWIDDRPQRYRRRKGGL